MTDSLRLFVELFLDAIVEALIVSKTH